jgi:hypothetical protein
MDIASPGRTGSGSGLALIAALLLVAGCSHPNLPPTATAPATATPAVASGDKPDAKAYEAASKACKEETETKGFSSVLGIFSRLRRGSAEEQFAACMKKKGYEV